jgi:hypothetical protein
LYVEGCGIGEASKLESDTNMVSRYCKFAKGNKSRRDENTEAPPKK